MLIAVISKIVPLILNVSFFNCFKSGFFLIRNINVLSCFAVPTPLAGPAATKFVPISLLSAPTSVKSRFSVVKI